MYPIQQFAWNELPPSLAYQIASFIRIQWLNDLKGGDRFWNFFDSPEVAAHFTISERDVLISHALIRRRVIEHLGNTYTLLGVGAVMTYPSFCKEGHGTRVVAAATNFILTSNADVGMLFAGEGLHPFYRQHGWIPLLRAGVYYGDPLQPQFDDGHTLMLFVSEKAKLHQDDFEQGDLFVGEFTW